MSSAARTPSAVRTSPSLSVCRLSSISLAMAIASLPRPRRLIRGRGRPEPAEAHRDDGVGSLGTRSVSRDGRDEVVPVERVELDVALRPYGGGARNVANERDLSEGVPRPEHPRRAAVCRHVHRPFGDDVEAIARIALREDLVPRPHGYGDQLRRE